MPRMTKCSWIALALAALLVPAFFAHPARGEACKTSKRPLTPEEGSFYARLTDIQAYLPQPPDGWRVFDTEIDGPDSLCLDREPGFRSGKDHLRGRVSVTFERILPPDSAANGAAVKDALAQVLVIVNDTTSTFPTVTSAPLGVVGASAAYRIMGKTEVETDSLHVPVSGATVVLLGSWKASSSPGRLLATPEPPANPLYTRLDNMMIAIRGSTAISQTLLEAINVQAIGRLLSH